MEKKDFTIRPDRDSYISKIFEQIKHIHTFLSIIGRKNET